MKIRISYLTILLLLFVISTAKGGEKHRTIKVKGDYHHSVTNTVFPESFGTYNRQSIIAYDQGDTNVCVSYLSSDKKAFISVYIYPAPMAIESRLRDEYRNEEHNLVNNLVKQEIYIGLRPMKIEKDGYKVVGISGDFTAKKMSYNITLFECGKYFLKYRINLKGKDTVQLRNIYNELTQTFSPADIVKVVPLKLGITLNIAPGIVHDSVFLNPVLAGVNAKLKWVDDYVDSLERISGFPDLYMGEQLAYINALLDKWESMKHHVDPDKEQYFIQLMEIRKAGYLKEFLVNDYRGLLYYSKDVHLHMDEYFKWWLKNGISVSMNGPKYFYLLGYE